MIIKSTRLLLTDSYVEACKQNQLISRMYVVCICKQASVQFKQTMDEYSDHYV